MLYENLEIAPEDLPQVMDLDFNSHPKRYLRFRLLMMSILFLLLLTPVIIVGLSGNSMLGGILASVWLLLLVLRILFEFKAFPFRGYLVRDKDISYRAGLLFREVTTVPYNRIQHSEVSHGPIARMMKLATLKIYTAGGSSSDLAIHGLDPAEAEKLKEWLTEKTANHV